MKTIRFIRWMLLVLIIVSLIPFFGSIIEAINYWPIDKDEARQYTGVLQEYYPGWNAVLEFTDGTRYEISYEAVTDALNQKMEALPSRAELQLLFDPDSGKVYEIRSQSQELLSFASTQAGIRREAMAMIQMGVLFLAIASPLIFLLACYFINERKEKRLYAFKRQQSCTHALRRADTQLKFRVLLQAKVEGYAVCYRRVRFVDELVVNGYVYDEKKSIFQFEHNLYAALDGHTFEAGIDKSNYRYISFDGERIDQFFSMC